MKPSVYIDTTIPSYLFDNRESLELHIKVTNKWWDEERSNFDVWASEATIDEIKDGNYPSKADIIRFLAQVPVLPSEPKITQIAQIYLDNYLMPLVLKGDALHLAYASFYKINFLLTWNCNHLANANKRKHIEAINDNLNLATPAIITPLELFSETSNDNQ